MGAFIQDIRYGLRMLGRNPGFSAVVVLTLMLGIGATTVIFTFVNAVIVRPLPYPDSNRLVVAAAPAQGADPFPWHPLTPAHYFQWHAANRTLDMAAFSGGTVSLTGVGEPERLLFASVTAGFFEALGVAPVVGRAFTASDAVSNAPAVAVITSSLWKRRFESNPSVVGASIMLDGRPVTIVGVMPDGFEFPREFMYLRIPVELWTPNIIDPNERGNAFLRVVARLKPNVSLAQAQAELQTINRRIDELENRTEATEIRLVPLHERVVARIRPLLLLFFGAVGLVLLIACTNVANMLLARGTSRVREVAIRSAMGSGRARLVRQFLTESMLLGLLGGATGLLAAIWGTDWVRSLIPASSLPRLEETAIDWQAFAFAVAVSLIASVLFGLGPALHASATDITTNLKEAPATQTGSSRWLKVLVVCEVALAFVLLAAAGLLIKSFGRLTGIDPGFKPESILTLSVTLPETGYETSPQMRAFSTEVLDRLRAVPGVIEAAAINWLPLGGNLLMGDFTVEGINELPQGLNAAKPAISPDYFKTMGIPIVRGRAFSQSDSERSAGVAIVNDRLARFLWPDQDPIGKRLKIGFGKPDSQPWLTVVGVAGNIKQNSLAERPRPIIYVPIEQAPRPFLLRNLTFVARTDSDPRRIASALRHEVRQVDPKLPFDRVETMEQLLAMSVAEPRFRSAALGGFAALALILVATGILGVLAYSVSRRTREIGVRMALGAQRVDVVTLVLRSAIAMTLAGLVLGLGGALMLNRLLTDFLFEVHPADGMTLAAVSMVLLAVALVASYVPARRASNVDPIVALRPE